ncbi:MAG: cytochrome c [Chloroflexi bacterium]|nr:cytochrome c [Chloroflexota bacterium]
MRTLIAVLALALLAGFAVLSTLPASAVFPMVASPEATPVDDSNGDPARGESIFRRGTESAPPCISCHAIVPGGFGIAPNLAGVPERAGFRVEGLTADAYLRQSILDPLVFIVPGFRPIMVNNYAELLSDQELADLVAFLSTMTPTS